MKPRLIVKPNPLRCAAFAVPFLLSQVAIGQSVNRLWQNNCISCHGEKGEGVSAPSLLTAAWPDELLDAQASDRRLYDAVRYGVEGVDGHAFAEQLSPEESWALVNYLHELRERARRERVPAPGKRDGEVVESQHERYTVETVVDGGLSIPWGIAWLPDGRMLITERPGSLRIWDGRRLSRPVRGTPEVLHRGQGGLMEVAVDPHNPGDGWVYLAYTEELKGGEANLGMTTLVRGRLDGERWTDQELLYRAEDEHFQSSGLHFGCRIVFDGDGHLFFAIGERGYAPLAQDLGRPNGKVHRITLDGRVPADNPFVDEPGALPTIWSYGHRNPQGLVMDLEGRLWDTEHGPRGGDELNLIERGANYGWPTVSYGINYNGRPLVTPFPEDDQDFVMPVYHWNPSIAVCGLDVVSGGAFPGWRGDLLAGGLAGEVVDRLRIDSNNKIIEREELIRGRGRVRDVQVGPDGFIYIALNGPDEIVRLVPASGG